MAVWTFGRSLARVLPHPALNISALYMLGAVGGGLVSVNLAPELVAVAAGGGACALVGESFRPPCAEGIGAAGPQGALLLLRLPVLCACCLLRSVLSGLVGIAAPSSEGCRQC